MFINISYVWLAGGMEMFVNIVKIVNIVNIGDVYKYFLCLVSRRCGEPTCGFVVSYHWSPTDVIPRTDSLVRTQ